MYKWELARKKLRKCSQQLALRHRCITEIMLGIKTQQTELQQTKKSCKISQNGVKEEKRPSHELLTSKREVNTKANTTNN